MYDIQNALRQLAALWLNPIAANLARIRDLCNEIGTAAAADLIPQPLDPKQLCRIGVLSRRAEERIACCIAADIGSGGYGDPARPRVSTAQWEG